MINRIFIVCTVLIAVTAHSQEPDNFKRVGEISSGMTAYLDEAGKLHFSSLGMITLSNGQILRRSGDTWSLWSAPAALADGAKALSGLDFSAYREDYIGQRVLITDGEFFGADADHAFLRLRGSNITVYLKSVPRDMVRKLIDECDGLVTSQKCGMRVSGLVSRDDMGDYSLKEVMIDRPHATSGRPTSPLSVP